MSINEIFTNKGYEAYVSQDFYSCKTFIEKQGRNSEHINSNVNGKNSGWPNAAHIILPYASMHIDVIKEAQEGNLLSYLESKFNEKRDTTFIYQPSSQNYPFYQRFKISSESGMCRIEKDGDIKNLSDLIPDIKKDGAVYDTVKENMYTSQSNSLDNTASPTPDLFADDSTHTPSQIIYYGVPGCGKSNKIFEALKDVPDFNKIRTVFHPEYTNADFIGQILPKSDGEKISYQFTPGPFTEILARAYQKPEVHFYLVIEEINRGNAAAIFGDVFQLLDRDDSGKSQYPVHNKDLREHLQKDEIRLPSNFSIIATMNTSDQNVFTLDNAFQRRFDMVLVRSGVTRKNTANVPRLNPDDYDFKSNGENIQNQFNATIEGTDTKWGLFWDWINFQITEKLQGISSTEDKRLGLWFVKNVDEKIHQKVFAEKVLKYLWDDVFKFKRREIFTDDIHSLEELISVFEGSPDENILSRIFRNYPENSSN